MTLVTVDITGVASSTGPNDRVVLRAPMIREKTGGGLVDTREEIVHLTQGIGEVELEPGPVMVKFLCEGVSDTREKMGVVPKGAGPVDIFDVLSDSLDYPTPVVGAAQAAKTQAQDAAERAEAGADSAWAWSRGELLMESPPGSGLYAQHPGLFIESPDGSGLYEFLA